MRFPRSSSASNLFLPLLWCVPAHTTLHSSSPHESMTPSFLPRPLRDPPPLVLPPGDGSEPSTALVPPPVPCIPSSPPSATGPRRLRTPRSGQPPPHRRARPAPGSRRLCQPRDAAPLPEMEGPGPHCLLGDVVCLSAGRAGEAEWPREACWEPRAVWARSDASARKGCRE